MPSDTAKQNDTAKARIFWPDGRIEHFDDQQMAYRLYIGLPPKFRCAFRGKHDARPVHPGDMVAGVP
jgi:hypothetical protein